MRLRLERPPRKRPRRRRHPAPLYASLTASALLLVAAFFLWRHFHLGDTGQPAAAERPARARDRAALRRLLAEKDPFQEGVERLLAALRARDLPRLQLYLDLPALHDYLARAAGRPERYARLSLADRLAFPELLLRRPPFDDRWRLGTVGEYHLEPAQLPEHPGAQWLVVPRRFPGGKEDTVRLLLVRSGTQPQVVGAECVEPKPPPGIRKRPEIDLPRVQRGSDLKPLDPKLKEAPLPAAPGPGGVDAAGKPTAPIARVPLPRHLEPALRTRIEGWLTTLVDPGATRAAATAHTELVRLGKPVVPFLLNRLVGLDLGRAEDVFVAHQVVQVLRDLTGQRFGFEPQVGEGMLTAADAAERRAALERWFGWWRYRGKTFVPRRTPARKDERKRRDRP